MCEANFSNLTGDRGLTVIGQSKLTGNIHIKYWEINEKHFPKGQENCFLEKNLTYECTASVSHSFDAQQHTRFQSLADMCLALLWFWKSFTDFFSLAGCTFDSCCTSFQTEKSSDQSIWISFCFTTRPWFICVVYSQCRYEGMSLAEKKTTTPAWHLKLL